MAIIAGVDGPWMAHDNKGRYHSATKGIVQTGLVLNLDAGAVESYPGSGTTWTDLSPSGASGVLTNGPTFSSANGGGIVFDGTNDYVQLEPMSNYQLLTSDYITVDLWFKANSFASRQYLFENRSGALTSNPFPLYTDASGANGLLRIYNNADTTVRTIYPNIIYNICYTIDSTITTNNLKFYDSGSLQQTFSYNVNGAANTSNIMYLGRAYPDGAYRWNGPIYKFSLYNKILTADEVRRNFTVTRSRFGV